MESKDIKVLEELAGNGDVGALCKLGELYLTGNGGVGVDLNKARGLFEAASAKGSNGANYNLGKMYYNGTGVGTNHAKAKEYFEKSANADNVFSKYYLGKLYYWGDGVEKDYNKANEYKVHHLKGFWSSSNGISISDTALVKSDNLIVRILLKEVVNTTSFFL